MKNILLAFDGHHFPRSVFEFVSEMNKQQPIQATGVFLPPVDYAELLYSYGGIPAGPSYLPESVKTDERDQQQNETRFRALCATENIACKVHNDFTEHIVKSLQGESRFADLLVLNSKSFYENLGTETQQDYIANVVHKSECPVMLVPDNYRSPDSIIMAYDGSAQALFAIRQFTYLFPGYRNVPVLLVYLDAGTGGVPERVEIGDYVSLFYEHISVLKLKLTSSGELRHWIAGKQNTMLVTGAYGRSLISQAIRKSFIAGVVKDHTIPVFVAHK